MVFTADSSMVYFTAGSSFANLSIAGSSTTGSSTAGSSATGSSIAAPSATGSFVKGPKMTKSQEAIYGPIIPVIVGAVRRRKYHVHQNWLTEASGLARAALTGPFKEASEKVLRLPEEEEIYFGGFMRWLFLRRCTKTDDQIPTGVDMKNLENHVKLYALGERLAAPEFQKFILNRLRAAWGLNDNKRERYDFWFDLIPALQVMSEELVEDKMDEMRQLLLWLVGRYFERRPFFCVEAPTLFQAMVENGIYEYLTLSSNLELMKVKDAPKCQSWTPRMRKGDHMAPKERP